MASSPILLTTSRSPSAFVEKHNRYGSALSLPVRPNQTPARLAVTLALTTELGGQCANVTCVSGSANVS